MTRRHFLLAAGAWPVALPAAEKEEAAAAAKVQPLSITVDPDANWGDAPVENVHATCLSAAEAIWQHCAGAKMPGIFLTRHEKHPLCAFDHDEQDRVVIYVTTQGTYWSQLAFQFAHEFCHALVGHADDYAKKHRAESPNKWFEESLCELASLFALRSLAKSWQENPPYSNWKSYAQKHAEYAAERLDDERHQLPEKAKLADWLRLQEPGMRKTATLREPNTVVAAQLLLLFEKEPQHWGCVSALGLVKPDAEATLREHFVAWKAHVPAAQHGLFERLGEAFNFRV